MLATPCRVLLALLLAMGASAPAQSDVTTPEAFFGHRIGADHFLADYTQLTGYWRKIATESDRMVLEEIGTTSYGQTMLLAVISSPKNLARREALRANNERLCRARDLNDDEARQLARDGVAVVWIDGGLHATESVAAQNIIELVYRMTSRDDAETRRILDQVILLVCPANPDGMEMIARAYMATRRVGNIPVLYQRYVGHDNNRDFYMANMPETAAINRALYRRWYPQIVYNHHQSAPRGTIIFTPPFRDPFNFNIDPRVIRGIELVSAHMNNRFAREGKPGVISRTGASYSTWWNGGLRTTCYFHNMVGILTESFGSPNPTQVRQSLSRRLPSSDYPDPVGTQTWHARQTIEYLQTANFAILDLAARYREELLYTFFQMGRDAIRKGSGDHWTPTPRLVEEARRREQNARRTPGEAETETDSLPPDAFADLALRDPRAYVLPADQPDFAAATRLVNALIRAGVDVHRARESFSVGGARYAAGSYVVFTAQAFRAHVLDMFEPQWHPDDLGAAGDPVRPYDSAGWTPALQMDVAFDRILDGFEGPFDRLADEAQRPPGRVTEGRAGWLIRREDSDAFLAANRLLVADESVSSLRARWRTDQHTWPPGTMFVARGERSAARVEALAKERGVTFTGIDTAPDVAMSRLRAPRIGLFDVYGGNMATGWTRWVLERWGFSVRDVFGQRIHDGDLRRDFDVLVFCTGLPSARDGQRIQRALRRGRPNRVSLDDLDKMTAALPPFEDWSRAADRMVRLEAEKAIPALRTFVEDGGRLLALGSQASALVAHFDLPVRVGTFTTGEDGKERRTRSSEFFIPTSLVRAEIDTDHPLGHGMGRELAMVYRRSPVLAPKDGAAGVEVVARYAAEDILMSGWAIGAEHLADKAAVLAVPMGHGAVYLFGADVIFRGQAQGSFKLLFNALLGG